MKMLKTEDLMVSTHSRPKAAAHPSGNLPHRPTTFQLTAARRRLPNRSSTYLRMAWFQLTAARRRLLLAIPARVYSAMFQLTAARRRLLGAVMRIST